MLHKYSDVRQHEMRVSVRALGRRNAYDSYFSSHTTTKGCASEDGLECVGAETRAAAFQANIRSDAKVTISMYVVLVGARMQVQEERQG